MFWFSMLDGGYQLLEVVMTETLSGYQDELVIKCQKIWNLKYVDYVQELEALVDHLNTVNKKYDQTKDG